MQREMRAAAATTSVSPPSQEAEQQAEKYLTFRVGIDAFAVPFSRVREIMSMQEITAAPESPAFVKGTINLRGKIVPVVDLRLKFGLPGREHKPRTCMVVVQIEEPTAGKLIVGIIVDTVVEVLTLRAGDIRNGAARVGGKIKTLLDLDRLLSTEEMHSLVAVCY
ncbi:MAG TPA: chemotaxis protein CheW [Bryobacteraceae bacterium]